MLKEKIGKNFPTCACTPIYLRKKTNSKSGKQNHQEYSIYFAQKQCVMIFACINIHDTSMPS